jgi:hypothetical protein
MMRGYRRWFAAIAVSLSCVAWSTLACAETWASGPGWQVYSHSDPTNVAPGAEGVVLVVVYNIGASGSQAGATVTDELPAGVVAVNPNGWTCNGGSPETCTMTMASGIGSLQRTELELPVEVNAGVAEGPYPNHVTISGGGAGPVSQSSPLTVSSKPAGFGFDAHVWASNADGTIDTQAGSHPYAFNFTYEMNLRDENGTYYIPAGHEEIRNLTVNAPPGFVGNATAVPRCPRALFDEGGVLPECPASTQIGELTFALGEGGLPGEPQIVFRVPVYNLAPPPGMAAQFGLELLGVDTFLDAGVRSGGDYGISVHVNHVPQRELAWASLTLYNPSSTAFLTMPTSCSRPLTFSASAFSWRSSSTTAEASAPLLNSEGEPAALTGCEQLGFGPSLSVAPDTSYSDTPAGLTVELTTPQEGLTEPGGHAMSNIEDTKVVLPEGVAINPGQATGLQACQPSQDGLERLPDGEENDGPPSCPNASKVGTDEIETPLLAKPLVGNVYVVQSNPPDLKLLVAASGEGVNVKLVGNVHLNEQTGQLTSIFEETPELPFTHFRLSFSGGAQAALATPTNCGTYTTTSDFTPWASPFLPDVFPSSGFQIASGPGGGACSSSPLPFSPELIAGSTTDQAGGFTDFSLLLRRGDGQQRIDGLQFKAPEGLTGFLSKVPLCTNAQAEANECPAASKIGHTVVESGPGPYPLVVPEPGQEPAPIYLTEAYDGAPFGLSIVVPLHVGPFVLPTQRVRAKIEVDPYTSALTITTDPLPQVVAGVPTDLREIDAVIERPEFMVNPTNCDPQEFSGTAYGTPPPGQPGPGASAAISSHFQVGSCRALEFSPEFSVSTSSKTSRTNGASLTAKVSYPPVAQGSQADIGLVKVELPKQLPSRLKTLQKACTSAQFEANPAGCPAASLIGRAVVHTPLLPVPLTGPAIFVSHGGEAFPSLTVVLQGDGVAVDLVGTTFISKAGITSTTFKTVPDDPFSTFELTLPEGPYSALTANGALCGQKLTMPTQFIGQNGAEIHQTTKIAVTGCSKTAHHRRKKRHHQSRQSGS